MLTARVLFGLHICGLSFSRHPTPGHSAPAGSFRVHGSRLGRQAWATSFLDILQRGLHICLGVFPPSNSQKALDPVGVLMQEGLELGSVVCLSQTRLHSFSGACCGLLSFPRLDVKGNAFYNHKPPGPPLFLRWTGFLGSDCGSQNHGMNPRESHFSLTGPDRSVASRRRLITEPKLEAIWESLWNFLSSDVPQIEPFRSTLFSRPFSVATWL